MDVMIIIQTILAFVLIIAVMVATPFLLMLVFSFAYSGPPPDAVRRVANRPRPAAITRDEDDEDDDDDQVAVVPPRPSSGQGER